MNFQLQRRAFLASKDFYNRKLNSNRDLLNASIDVRDAVGSQIASLVPICRFNMGSQEVISKLTMWRNEHQDTFPSRFLATDEGTRTWIESHLVENPDRMLFLVVDLEMRIVAHVGAAVHENAPGFELDSVMKGSQDLPPGFMVTVTSALHGFLNKEFMIDELRLKVLLSNTRAVKFYEKLGYVELERTGLRWDGEHGASNLVESDRALPHDSYVAMSKDLSRLEDVPQMILTAGPSVGANEIVYTAEAAKFGWNERHSDYLNEFEGVFREITGAKFAMATSSCTAALHLAYSSLGLGPGDEVIVPELTWVATAAAVRYTGATPVFADVDSRSWTMSTSSVRALITDKTKAIVPVHLYGYSADMASVMDLATEFDLKVVEDAAPSIGTSFGDRHVGTFGDVGCFSFQGAKLLVTGEGGMVVTDDPDIAKRLRKLQEHGRKPETFWIEELGFKYKMSNLQAAFGLGQLERMEVQVAQKEQINLWYRDMLSQVEGIHFQEAFESSKSIHWMTSIRFETELGIQIPEFRSYLKENGVDTRPVFPSISQYPMWPIRQDPQPISSLIARTAVNLPSGVGLSRGSVEKVSNTIQAFMELKRG